MPILVNGEYVDDSVLRQEAAILKTQLGDAIPDDDSVSLEMRAREWATENVIERTLLRQAAMRDPEPIAEEALERAIQQLRLSAGQAPSTMLQPFGNFRREAEAVHRVARLVSKLTAKVRPPAYKDVVKYYRQHRDRFYSPELVHAAHIVKNVDEGTEEAKAANGIRAAQGELARGKSFEETADAFSDCPGRGGDLGFFPRGQMVEEFDAVVFSMKAGEVSEIFRTPFGFHIAKVYDRKPEGVRGVSEVRDEIDNILSQAAKEKIVEQFVDRLRAKADIRKVRRS
jgi:parvulin-like peptidyl-prolyl isomerase